MTCPFLENVTWKSEEEKELRREDNYREQMQSTVVYLKTITCDPLVPPMIEAHQAWKSLQSLQEENKVSFPDIASFAVRQSSQILYHFSRQKNPNKPNQRIVEFFYYSDWTVSPVPMPWLCPLKRLIWFL